MMKRRQQIHSHSTWTSPFKWFHTLCMEINTVEEDIVLLLFCPSLDETSSPDFRTQPSLSVKVESLHHFWSSCILAVPSCIDEFVDMFPKSDNINIYMHFDDLDHSRACVAEILMNVLERICVLLLNVMCKSFFSSHNCEVVHSQLQKGQVKQSWLNHWIFLPTMKRQKKTQSCPTSMFTDGIVVSSVQRTSLLCCCPWQRGKQKYW